MRLVKSAPNLMQRLSRLPAASNITLLDRRKPKPHPWPHANTTFTEQIYIRWCCIDLSNAPRLPGLRPFMICIEYRLPTFSMNSLDPFSGLTSRKLDKCWPGTKFATKGRIPMTLTFCPIDRADLLPTCCAVATAAEKAGEAEQIAEVVPSPVVVDFVDVETAFEQRGYKHKRRNEAMPQP